MNKDKCWAKFKLTDISKGLSKKDVKNTTFSYFPTSLIIPKEGPKFMSLEEFITGKAHKENER